MADFDALMHGATRTNERMVFEQMIFSFVRVLETFGNDHLEVIIFLLTVLDKDPPLLNHLDGFSYQYWVQRVHGSTHGDALEIAKFVSMDTLC